MSDNYLYKSERLGLKPLSTAELDGNYPNWFLDEEVNRYNSHFRLPSSQDSVKAFVQSLVDDKTKVVCAVYWLENGLHIGNISLQQIDAFNRSAELAFLFGEKAYWGKGIAEEAARTIIEHGRKYLNIRRFTLGCLEVNVGMRRLAKKLNFAEEGCLSDSLWHAGEFQSVCIYGLNFES